VIGSLILGPSSFRLSGWTLVDQDSDGLVSLRTLSLPSKKNSR
jgi:hypothetical protein